MLFCSDDSLTGSRSLRALMKLLHNRNGIGRERVIGGVGEPGEVGLSGSKLYLS